MRDFTNKNNTFSKKQAREIFLKTAIPILILGFTNASYSFFDTLIAIFYVEDSEKILGIVSPIIMICSSIPILFIVGVGIFIPKKIGENDFEEAEKIFGQSFFLSFFIGLISVLFMISISNFWVNYFGEISISDSNPNKSDLINQGVNYLYITSLVFIPIGIRDSIVRTLRSEGFNKTSAFIPIFSIPINLFFDFIFMGYFDTGLIGAGYATVIGVFTSVLIAVLISYYLRAKNRTIINFNLENIYPKKEKIKIILSYGINSFFRRIFSIISLIFLSFGIVLLNSENPNYDDWSSFLTAILRMFIFANIIAISSGQATSLLISKEIGRKNKDNVKMILKQGTFFLMTFEIIIMIILMSLNLPILNLFKVGDSSNKEVYSQSFYIILILIPFSTLQIIPMMFYASTINIKSTINVSMINNLIIQPIFVLISYFIVFKLTLNYSMFFVCYIFNTFLQSIVSYSFFFKTYKKWNYSFENI